MKILFDNGVPRPIARCLTGHEITYARRIGWHELGNGELIRRAEDAEYDVLLSTDKNIRYQQNLTGGKSRWSYSATSNGRSCDCTSIE